MDVDKRLFGVRGAVKCQNEQKDILKKVSDLYDALIKDNGIEESDVVSFQFTVTPDLDCINPAAALRSSGRGQAIPLFCTAEPVIKGGRPGFIRVLMLCYATVRPRPAYIHGAESLRPDLSRQPPSEGAHS